MPDESKLSEPQSAKEELLSGFERGVNSNRGVANDMASGKEGTAYSAAQLGGIDGGVARDSYIAGSMVQYKFTCRDDWYDHELYTINLIITDADSETAPQQNHINSWKELP